MDTAIIFLSIFIIIISLMLEIKIKINFDLWANKLNICIYIFNIKIICINILLIGFYYSINSSKKLKPLSIFITEEESYLIKQIKSSILDKLYYESIDFNCDLGIGNAKDTALTSGNLILFCNYIKYLLSKKDCDFNYNILQSYVSKEIKFDLSIKVYFTVFDLLFAIIMSLYKRGRYAKERKKQREYR